MDASFSCNHLFLAPKTSAWGRRRWAALSTCQRHHSPNSVAICSTQHAQHCQCPPSNQHAAVL
jgi:hypothetical protein